MRDARHQRTYRLRCCTVNRPAFEGQRAAASGIREGTGLGLPLSKKLAEMHGGTLTLKSWPDEGTTVEVGLPPERTLADNIEVVPVKRKAP